MARSCVLFFYCCFLLASALPRSSPASDGSLEVEMLLARLNKPYVKTINSSDGDIIDCVDILRQAAFDHPLLQNHTIQLSPSVYSEEVNTSTSGVQVTQIWNKNGSCPKGTVPILRTRREDVVRARSLDAYGMKDPASVNAFRSRLTDRTGHEYAFGAVEGGRYFGAKGYFDVWNPDVQGLQEFSLAQIWVVAGHDPSVNTVEAGWQVSPATYGDHQTRFFIYWTSDGYQNTGCYNLRCSGFVQRSTKFVPGAAISPVSTYDGAQFEIGIKIWKDPHTRNWWLQVNNEPMGYWPNELFNSLHDFGSLVEWGGEVTNFRPGGGVQHTTTQMGSGHFPELGIRKAAYVRNLEIADSSAKWRPIKPQAWLQSASGCYRVKYRYNNAYENHIYYGGPGRNPGCP